MKKIIVADDSGMARLFIIKCLGVLGYTDYEIIECENGAEALEEVRKGGVSFLITDLTMPVMGGLELVTQMSEENISVDKLIVVTSAGNPAKEAELSRFGASIINKPISPAKLSEKLSSNDEADEWG